MQIVGFLTGRLICFVFYFLNSVVSPFQRLFQLYEMDQPLGIVTHMVPAGVYVLVNSVAKSLYLYPFPVYALSP